MANFNEKQLQAIDDRDNSLIISASAGTGKTTVLINRVTKLIIEDKKSVSGMLIMTFTDAAASELRLRLQSKLLEVLESEDLSDDVKVYLKSELRKLQSADISTIHSFCSKVIKENYHVLGIEPTMSVMDTIETNSLKKQCLDEVIEQSYSDEEMLPAIYTYTDNYGDKKLRSTVRKIYENAMSTPDPEKFMDYVLQIVNRPIVTVSNQEFYERLKVYLLDTFTEVYEEYEAMYTRLLDIGVGQKALGVIADEVNMIECIVDTIEDKGYQEVVELGMPKFGRLTFNKDDKAAFESALEDIDEYKDLRKELKDIVIKSYGGFFVVSEEEQIRRIVRVRQTIKSLINMTKKFKELYASKKIADNKLDYDDLILFAKNALEHSEVSAYYRNKFDYIFVDEYQDTNGAQDIIVDLIRRENNLYIVGDYKQSIYGFRKADPNLFLNREKYFKKEENKDYLALDLDQNYRTSPSILDYVNRVFSEIMVESFGGLNYIENGMLRSGRPDDFTVRLKPNFEVFALKDGRDFLDKHELYDKFEFKVRVLARKIQDIVGTTLYVNPDGTEKIASYSDIAVLVRSKSDKAARMKQIFKSCGLNLDISKEENLLEIIEVAILIRFLFYVDSSASDVDLIAVLRSELVGLTDGELYHISMMKGSTFYERYRAYRELKTADAKTLEKINAFERLVEYVRSHSHLSIRDRLNHVIEVTKYSYKVLGKEEGAILMDAVYSLLDVVSRFEKDRAKGLSYFVSYIKSLMDSGEILSYISKNTENAESVKLVTIHASKGLEFPVVILFDVSSKFNKNDLIADVLVDDYYGIVGRYIDREKGISLENLEQMALSRYNYEKLLQEESRLLYVAMTRAQYRLDILAFPRVFEVTGYLNRTREKSSILSANSYFDWLINCSGLRRVRIDKKEGIVDTLDISSKYLNAYIYAEDDMCFEENTKTELSLAMMNSTEGGEVELITSFVPSMIPKRSKIERKSVSKIAKKSDEDSLKTYSKTAFQPQKGVSAADIGNAYHKFMMYYMSSDKAVSDILSETEKPYLTELEKSLVDEKKLRAFEENDFTRELKKADVKWAEKEFIYLKDDEGILVQGIIDFAAVIDGKIVLLDYKTDRASKDVLVKRYTGQLELYKEALENLTGLSVESMYLYSIYNDEYVRVGEY